jgi:hypothetical protein
VTFMTSDTVILNLPGEPERDQPPDHAWQTLGQVLSPHYADGLFTVLRVERSLGRVRRSYTSNPSAYPCGGTKTLIGTPWANHVIEASRCFMAVTREQMTSAFADHDLLFELGCTTAMNLPIHQGGDVAWTVNLLRGGARYSAAECALVKALVCQWIEQISHA